MSDSDYVFVDPSEIESAHHQDFSADLSYRLNLSDFNLGHFYDTVTAVLVDQTLPLAPARNILVDSMDDHVMVHVQGSNLIADHSYRVELLFVGANSEQIIFYIDCP